MNPLVAILQSSAQSPSSALPWAALGAVAGAAVGALVAALFRRTEPYVQLKAQREDALLRERAQVHRDYLQPLLRAAQELKSHLENSYAALQDEAPREAKDRIGHLCRSAKRLKDEVDRSNAEGYLLFCNGEGVDGVDAMFVFATYFAAANRVRHALPSLQAALAQDLRLVNQSILAVERALNKDGKGIYETVQRSMGAYMSDGPGATKPYAAFCDVLVSRSGYPHFLALFDFIAELRSKRDYQLKEGVEALPAVVTSLEAVAGPSAG